MRDKYILILIIINLILTVFIAGNMIYVNLDQGDSKNDTSVDNKIDIIGTVTSINKTNDGIVMLVEDKDKTSAYDKASITVNKDTMIIKTIYSRTFTPKDINLGDKVQVSFIGPVAESYPVQAVAGFVWIIESEVE